MVQTKRSDFYELWQQHKQLKTMDMSEACPDIYDEGYIHQFQPETTAAAAQSLKISSHHCTKNLTSMEYVSNDHEKRPNNYKNRHKS